MKRILELISRLIRFHKLKMLVVFISAIGFFFIFFPFSDITDLVTQKVMELSGNQVLFQADRLNLGFFPSFSLSGDDVSLDIGTMPTIEARKIEVSPSLFSLIMLAFGSPPTSINASVDAEGFLGGSVSITHKPDGSSEDGSKKNQVSIKAESVQVSDILKFVDSPITIQGKASLDTTFDFYPAFDGQPDGQALLTSKGLKILPSTINTQMGPLPLPGVNWSQLMIKTHMSSSNLFLDDIAFGSAKDPLSGRVKGQMNVKVDKNGPILGAYDIKVELQVAGAAEKDLETMLILLKDYRQPTATGFRYMFRVTAVAAGATPNLGHLGSF